ncbi:hypothetical protein M0R88_00035 [Halorussus gelatinilyticus]|uniref:Uncharacterized protein n=1 Tax=Halorussus gelatinilyticus TaxID=2937524 RepID=A0A8U0IKD4_9EURY|nr:hypothetical protein [Halorussus gelatinilyticus]UPW00509.1 hypothetical protein M0R88_00035 [Halorussus gelatinilyticus]
MADDSNSPRRRDLLKAGATAGLLGVAGLSLNGVSAQETTTQAQGGTGVFSFSLRDGDRFRVRFRPRDPFGDPATETVPAACLGGDQSQEYQLFVVQAFRNDENIGFRGLLAPQQALAEDLLETTTAPGQTTEADGETTTAAAMQDQTTTAAGQATTTAARQQTTVPPGQLPEIRLGAWYRVSSSESCDGLNRLTIEAVESPQTTVS